MTFSPGLETLFVMLRDVGIRVGIEDIARLSEVFALAPSLDRDGLRRVLRSTLVKSEDEGSVFERVFETWLTRIEDQLEDQLQDQIERQLTGPESSAEEERAGQGSESEAAASQAAAKRAKGHAGDTGASDIQSGASSPGIFDEGADDDLSWLDPVGPDIGPGQPVVTSTGGSVMTKSMVAPMHDATTSAATVSESRGAHLVWLGTALVLVIVGILAFGVWRTSGSGSKSGSDVMGDASSVSKDNSADAGLGDVAFEAARVSMAQPTIEVVQQPPPERGYLGYLIAPLALFFMFWLWTRFGRGTWLPGERDTRARAIDGVDTGRRPPRRSLETLMLDERDEDELVWGVGRFVSEDTSRDLDIERTVRETASAFGRPVLCYRGAEYQREVWLWVDESVDTPVVRHLADDLTSMLEQSGLPVIRATFWGIPERLRTTGDEVLTIDAFDARRDSAAVVVLTDGRMMSLAHRARNRRGELYTLLHNLSYWPRVTFVDFGSGGDGRLGPICQEHGLRVIRPQDAASAISDLSEAYERPAEYDALVGDGRVWAAACSLMPGPVTERVALALRRELALEVSAWTVARLRAHARNTAGGIDFSLDQRAELLAWLLEAEESGENSGRPAGDGLLARMVDAWDRVLDRRVDSSRREAAKHGQLWDGSAAERELDFKRACIRMWTRPDQAAATLYRMRARGSEDDRATIERCLQVMAPREQSAREGVIALPWSLSDVRRETRVVLAEMGLGRAGAKHAMHYSMPAPGRVWIALGLCLGLFVGALASLAQQSWFTEPAPATIDLEDRYEDQHNGQYKDSTRAGNTYKKRTRLDQGTWAAEVGTPWARIEESVEPGQKATLVWKHDSKLCTEPLDEQTTVRRCNSNLEAPRPRSGLRTFWSFAIMLDVNDAQGVASELLDSGSVDGVYMVKSMTAFEWRTLATLARPTDQQDPKHGDQLLIVADEIPAGMEQYPGYPDRGPVIIHVNDIRRLVGVTDFDEDAPRSIFARSRLKAMEGSTGDFMVFGMGECGADGQPCCTGSVCTEGRCDAEENVCTARCTKLDNRCKDTSTALICADDGAMRDQACAADEICDEGLLQCRPKECGEGGPCPDKACPAKARECVGDTKYRECRADSSGWKPARSCPRDTRCVKNSGQCEATTPPAPVIDNAIITFQRVKHTSKGSNRAMWRYRLTCVVDSSGLRPEIREFEVTTEPSSALKGRVVNLPHATSPEHIQISCTLADARTVTSSSSKGRSVVQVASLEWLAEDAGEHRMTFRAAKFPYTATLYYRIDLLSGKRPIGASQQRSNGSMPNRAAPEN